jgi:hypothetical protein
VVKALVLLIAAPSRNGDVLPEHATLAADL